MLDLTGFQNLSGLLAITETIAGTNFSTTFTFDGLGRPATRTHPSGITETTGYNSYGYFSSVSVDNGATKIYEVTGMNERSQLTNATYGGTLANTQEFDTYGYPKRSTTGSVQDYGYSFDAVTGNLNSRQNYLRQVNQNNLSETFGYTDGLDRLNTVIGPQNLAMTYAANGNIRLKTDIHPTVEFSYGLNAGPYALTGLTATATVIPTVTQNAAYTSFEKVNMLNEGTYTATFKYNPDNQRAKMDVVQNGTNILTRWYAGSSYMKETASGVTKEYTYLGGDAYSAPVVAVKQNGTNTYYYLLRDYLGNLTHTVNASTNAVQEYRFDAWGRRRNPANWSYDLTNQPELFADRGYTSHEHLKWFNVVNMNGRLYDPLIARFLNVDPYVQMPDYTQNLNRYSYCLNNPLKYTDPNGEFIFTALLPGIGVFIDAACWGAVIGGAGYTASVAFSNGGFNWNWGQFGKSAGLGAISGVATAGIGDAFGAIGSNGIGGEIARAYTHGFANGMISEFSGGDFMSGFVSGGLGSLGGSAFMMYGGRFASSTLGNYAFSGLSGGLGAELSGGNFWEGAASGLMTTGLNHLQQGLTRPNFDDLLSNYPTNGQGGDMPANEVYELIGGDVLSEHNSDPNAYTNACALRTSRALNYAGTGIPRIPGQTLTGADGKNYFFRASDLYKWMSKPAVFGKPNISTSDFSKLAGNRGVFIMQANYPARFGAWGHATLYNMTGCMGGHCYNGSYAYRYNLWNF